MGKQTNFRNVFTDPNVFFSATCLTGNTQLMKVVEAFKIDKDASHFFTVSVRDFIDNEDGGYFRYSFSISKVLVQYIQQVTDSPYKDIMKEFHTLFKQWAVCVNLSSSLTDAVAIVVEDKTICIDVIDQSHVEQYFPESSTGYKAYLKGRRLEYSRPNNPIVSEFMAMYLVSTGATTRYDLEKTPYYNGASLHAFFWSSIQEDAMSISDMVKTRAQSIIEMAALIVKYSVDAGLSEQDHYEQEVENLLQKSKLVIDEQGTTVAERLYTKAFEMIDLNEVVPVKVLSQYLPPESIAFFAACSMQWELEDDYDFEESVDFLTEQAVTFSNHLRLEDATRKNDMDNIPTTSDLDNEHPLDQSEKALDLDTAKSVLTEKLGFTDRVVSKMTDEEVLQAVERNTPYKEVAEKDTQPSEPFTMYKREIIAKNLTFFQPSNIELFSDLRMKATALCVAPNVVLADNIPKHLQSGDQGAYQDCVFETFLNLIEPLGFGTLSTRKEFTSLSSRLNTLRKPVIANAQKSYKLPKNVTDIICPRDNQDLTFENLLEAFAWVFPTRQGNSFEGYTLLGEQVVKVFSDPNSAGGLSYEDAFTLAFMLTGFYAAVDFKIYGNALVTEQDFQCVLRSIAFMSLYLYHIAYGNSELKPERFEYKHIRCVKAILLSSGLKEQLHVTSRSFRTKEFEDLEEGYSEHLNKFIDFSPLYAEFANTFNLAQDFNIEDYIRQFISSFDLLKFKSLESEEAPKGKGNPFPAYLSEYIYTDRDTKSLDKKLKITGKRFPRAISDEDKIFALNMVRYAAKNLVINDVKEFLHDLEDYDDGKLGLMGIAFGVSKKNTSEEETFERLWHHFKLPADEISLELEDEEGCCGEDGCECDEYTETNEFQEPVVAKTEEPAVIKGGPKEKESVSSEVIRLSLWKEKVLSLKQLAVMSDDSVRTIYENML